MRGAPKIYETAVQQSTALDRLGLSAKSREHLQAAYSRACCAECGHRVAHADRVVVDVREIGEHRIFHRGCADTGPLRLRLAASVATRRPASREQVTRRLERKIAKARAWIAP